MTSIPVTITVGLVLAVSLAVPTVAISLDDDSSGAVQFEPTSEYASIEDGKLTLDIDGINERATTSIDELFEVTVTDEEVQSIWLSHDVDGLTFYAEGDRDADIDESTPLDAGVDETTTVGLSVDTTEATSGTETFTIHVEYGEDDGGEGPGGPGPNKSPDDSVERTDADLNVTNATVDRTEVAPGETVTVTATVETDGDEPVQGPVALKIDGLLVDSQSVAVEPDAPTNVSFDWRFDETGAYDVSVGGVEAGAVTVSQPDNVRATVVRQLSSPLTFAVAPPAGLGMLVVISGINARRRS